ncbi:hypothetical protein GALMADRAFT_235848 [Galerina marginata CBS 339.88]|uniref:Ribosomal RNA-processing protein 8 n=1 Tax=Galerina marginata (strain CBS 339.88) TaxID=685588 RepID=A0A067TK41_GALM3|nr:hypothetical protein GALMADRAFT_235848 [Galerina marginata CBS 339.88]
MALFQVPGWSVPAIPLRDGPHQSKKRKRPAGDNDKLETAEVNLEKLMSKLTSIQPEESRNGSGHSKLLQGKSDAKKRRKKSRVSVERQEEQKHGPSTLNSNMQRNSLSEKLVSLKNETSPKSMKKEITRHNASSLSSKPGSTLTRRQSTSNAGLTALQKGMKEKLDGARFRLINENLYKSNSRTAHQMMRDDPHVFEEYHTGFRHQVISWPTNPVEHYISAFSSYPKNTVMADLGCGDAALAKGLLPKGISVISFDLVSDNVYVVEADTCDKVPLPGSEGFEKEKSMGEGQVVDVVVCALSLMGVNWVNCIREAWRILKAGGELHIAEVTSRFTDIEQFQQLLSSLGFRLTAKDESNTHFILLKFTKDARTSKTENEWVKLMSKGSILKPCEYKRR